VPSSAAIEIRETARHPLAAEERVAGRVAGKEKMVVKILAGNEKTVKGSL
jgi:hypothetical protein